MALLGTRSRAVSVAAVVVSGMLARRGSSVPFAPAAGRKAVDVEGRTEGRRRGKEENGL